MNTDKWRVVKITRGFSGEEIHLTYPWYVISPGVPNPYSTLDLYPLGIDDYYTAESWADAVKFADRRAKRELLWELLCELL